ncbi:MAG: BrnA antitoxin family protein [Gammaproteobacteria bacterium]|nr:BrnA antitoxin family protein [Gammaproteobacteria bacterium]
MIKQYTRAELRKMTSLTDWAALDTLKDEDIDYSDIPEATPELWENSKVVDLGRKQPISIRLDQDILNWFKAQKGRYQKRINQVLRSYMEAHAKPR